MNFTLFVSEVRARSKELGVGALRVTNTSPGALRNAADNPTHKLTLRALPGQTRLLGAVLLAYFRREPVVLFGSERQFVASAAALVGLRSLGVPVVFKFTGNGLGQFLKGLGTVPRSATVLMLNRMTAVLCQTQILLQEVRELGVHNAVLSPGYRRVSWHALPAVRTVPARERALRLVHLGLVSRSKGVHDVLRALIQLGRPDVSVDLVGVVPDTEQKELEALLARTPQATLVGEFRGDATTLLARYDALVLPSFHPGEGHAGVVIEAMAAGIPVLTSCFQALPELVTDRENGLLVEPHDVPALAQAIAFLADHPEERVRMGHAHRARLPRHDLRDAVDLVLGLLDIPTGSSAE